MTALRKKPTRYTKTTILIVGEGPTEKAFLQHVKDLFITRVDTTVVKIECGAGGAPCCVVQKAIRLRGSRAYDKCFVLIDSDRPLETDGKLAYRMKKRPPVQVLKATPCIEGLFLSILKFPDFSQDAVLSNYCKREFETNYIQTDRKTDKHAYSTLFPRDLLERLRKDIPELEAILKAMQG